MRPDLYLEVVTEHEGPVDPATVTVSYGQFHDVVLTPGRVYRFPRTRQARELLPRRAALLTALANSELRSLVPRPLATLRTGRTPDVVCQVITRLPGRPLHEGASAAELVAELRPLLSTLVKLGTEPHIRSSLPPAPGDRWHAFAEEVRSALFPLMSPAGRRVADRELAAVERLPAATPTALVHGDLGGANLLWDLTRPAATLTGVVDWDEAHLGDPAEDLASVAATYGWAVARGAATAVDRPQRLIAHAEAIQRTFALQEALPAALSDDDPRLVEALRRYR